MGVCYREIIIKSMPELKMIACHEPRIITNQFCALEKYNVK